MIFEGPCTDGGRLRGMDSLCNDVVAWNTADYRVEYNWVDQDKFTYSAFMDKGEGEFTNLIIAGERQ